jgi:hypothetical protein
VGALASADERRQQLIGVINEELGEISRLNKQIGARKPTLLLRMAELYLEKARLINEAENRSWLMMSPEDRLRRDEKNYFNKSLKNYMNAQKTCYYILKRFKNFKGRGEVYYILAFNAKEFQQPKRAGAFFKKALKFSSPGSETNTKARLALAEMYYNQKEYKKAEPLYRSALKGKKERWWTKDAYNLSWCYFRNGKEKSAISLMTKVHAMSGDRNYVDVRDMVERDLAYFYSATGQTKSAIAFYRKVGKNVSSNLLKVGKYLKSKGRYEPAEGALSEALKYSKDNRELAAIGIELLSLYDRFGKVRDHLKVSEVLYELDKSGHLDEGQHEKLKYHVAKMSAQLQKQVVAKTYRNMKKVRASKARYATRYFQLQSKLEGKLNQKSIFHAAETQYAINKYDDAAELYNQSYEIAKSAKDKKIMKLSLDGLLASLGGRGVSKATTDKYLMKSYGIYLKNNPRSSRSDKIYQRLFSSYYKQGDLKSAENVLEKYLFHFPKKHAQHEAMLARLMDSYRAKDNRVQISKWVGKINQGEVKVTKAYATKLKQVLLSMQFDKVQKYSTSGNKVQALKGYSEIYNNQSSTKEAKKNAAYNIAVLYHELGDKNKTYYWIMKALSRMNGKDVLKFDDSLLLIATGLFDYRETRKAANVYESTFKKVCKYKSKNKVSLYKNASALYLSDGNIEKAIELTNYSKRCAINETARSEVNLDILYESATQERWQYVKNLLKELESKSYNKGSLIAPIAKLRDVLISRGRIKQARSLDRKINVIYAKSKSARKRLPVEALDIVSSYKIENMIDISKQISRLKLVFPEKRYNAALKKKFVLLDKLTTKAVDLFRIGSGVGTVHGYKILVKSYSSMAKDIKSFTPKGSKDYIVSFKKSMASIANPITAKANDYKREAKQKIINNKILSSHNYYFMGGSKMPIVPMFFPSRKGVIMDRGGRK